MIPLTVMASQRSILMLLDYEVAGSVGCAEIKFAFIYLVDNFNFSLEPFFNLCTALTRHRSTRLGFFKVKIIPHVHSG